MFVIGDKVVHPMHGAGVIDRIVTEKVGGVVRDYYVFKMPMNGLILKIPTNNADIIGIRPVASQEQIEAILINLPHMPFQMDINWNRRYRENLNRMRSGDLMEIAMVIKGLMRRNKMHSLSIGERKMLYTAKQILISEISIVEDMDYKAAEQRINTAVQQV